MKTLTVAMVWLSLGLFAVAFKFTIDRMMDAAQVMQLAQR